MPFSSAKLPSIALAQLKSMMVRELQGRVEVKNFHFNLDCLNFLGPQLYSLISGSVQANTSGLGDWFFSREAVPEMPNNTDACLARHFSEYKEQLEVLKGLLSEKRRAASAFLTALMDRYEHDQYDLAGMTSMFSQNLACFAIARRLKARKSGHRHRDGRRQLRERHGQT